MQRLMSAAVAAVMLCCMLTFGAFALSEQKVYDNAGILSDKETEELEKIADEMSSSLLLDIAVITGDGFDGRATYEYAESFARQNSFGYDENGDGVMIVADYERGKVCIYASGIYEFVFSDEVNKGIIEQIAESETPFEYFKLFLSCVEKTVKNALESAGAAKKNLIDSDEVLSRQEFNALEASIRRFNDKYDEDVYIVVVADTGDKPRREYAVDFLKSHGGSDDVLFLLVVDGRKLEVYADGTAEKAFTEYGIKKLMSEADDSLSKGDYYKTLVFCLDTADKYLEKSAAGVPFDKGSDDSDEKRDKTDSMRLMINITAVLLIIVFIVLLVIKKSRDYDKWEQEDEEDIDLDYEDIYSQSESFEEQKDEQTDTEQVKKKDTKAENKVNSKKQSQK